jgi:tRNA nucleotidyltransferase (CCA-adding enzyme)
MMVLDMAARLSAPLDVRFACLCHDLGKGNTPADVLPRHIGHEQRSVALLKALSERLRAPADCRELAEVVAREHGHVHQCEGLSATALVRLLERLDAFRKPQRMPLIVLACECDARGRLGFEERPYTQGPHLMRAMAAATSVVTAELAQRAMAQGQQGPDIAKAIHRARIDAVAKHQAAQS